MASVKNVELEKIICEAVFRRDVTNVPTTFYIGLGTGVLPAKDALLSSLAEVAGPGYGRQAIEASIVGFPTLILAAGNWKIVSTTESYFASGTWTAADYLFVCDVASGTSGRLFGAVTIPEPFVHQDGEEFQANFEYQDLGSSS